MPKALVRCHLDGCSSVLFSLSYSGTPSQLAMPGPRGVFRSLLETVALNSYGTHWKHSWKWICGSETKVPVSSSGTVNLSSCFLVPGLGLSPSDKAVHSLALCRGLTTDCGVNPVFPERDQACGLLIQPFPSAVPVTYLDG